MEIKPSTLLSPTSKMINFYDCKLIATEGPNMMGSINLGGLNIPYDSYSTTKIAIPKNRDIPLMYGSLGTNVTLVGIFPKFTSTNPQCCTEADMYIEFWFEDNPSHIFYTTYGFFLATNTAHKIKQMYIRNTTDITVIVELMVADLGEIEISPYLEAIDNLYWNSIISDKIIGYDNTGGTYSGSTQFEVYDAASTLKLAISYDKISAIQKLDSLLTVITATDDIELSFINDYNSYQAYSRMNWAVEGDVYSTIISHRFMTVDAPGLDNTPPVVTYNSGATITGYTYVSGGTITKTNLIDYFVSGVTDYDDDGLLRDGIINIYNGEVTIRKYGSLVPVSAITEQGHYEITLQYRDLANNVATITKELIVDLVGPVFLLKNIASVLNFCVISECVTYLSAITYDQLKTNYITSCIDAVDGSIAFSNIGVTITSGVTTFSSITYIGDYTISFNASDIAHNSTTTGFTAHIRETELASLLDIVFNTGYTGSIIYVPAAYISGFTAFINETISGITDVYEPWLVKDGIVLTDIFDVAVTYPLVDGTDYKFTITNTSGVVKSIVKTLSIT